MSAPRSLGGVALTGLALAVAIPHPAAGAVLPGLPVMVGLGVFLLIFASAYGGLAHRMPRAGGLYAPVAQGLGRPFGLGAAWLALAAYHALQAGLYGMLGAVAAPLVDAPWWAVAGACWLLVAGCGLLPLRVAAVPLGLAVLGGIVVTAMRTTVDLTQLSWRVAASPSEWGVLLLAGALTFVGFEVVAGYGWESRRVPPAAYGSIVVLIVLRAALLMGTAVLPGWMATPARWLTVAGLAAGALALHATMLRYLAALGRERVFPPGLARLRVASLTQSVAAGLTLGAFVVLRIDPAGGWAARLGLVGGLGVLLLLLGTALAALFFLNRRPAGEGLWRRLVAPLLASTGFGVLVWLAGVHHGYLLAAASAPLLIGFAHALALRLTQPVVYAGVGLGGEVVVVAPDPARVPEVVAHPRMPGAHRPDRVRRKELTSAVRRRTPGSG